MRKLIGFIKEIDYRAVFGMLAGVLGIAAILAGVVGVVLLVGWGLKSVGDWLFYPFIERTYTNCIVTDKKQEPETKSHAERSRVFSNCGVFTTDPAHTDNITLEKVDVYSDIQVGKTYDFTGVGIDDPEDRYFFTIEKIKEV